MAVAQHEQIDAVTGRHHRPRVGRHPELNTPLPRWWLWLFYATIIWSIGYWVVYPAWPLVSSYSSGLFHWNSRSAVAVD